MACTAAPLQLPFQERFLLNVSFCFLNLHPSFQKRKPKELFVSEEIRSSGKPATSVIYVINSVIRQRALCVHIDFKMQI